MGIEVKQMVIKSTVLQKDGDKADASNDDVICQDEPEPIADSPSQLRQLTEEIFRAARER